MTATDKTRPIARKNVAKKKVARKQLPGALRWWPFLVGIFFTPGAVDAMNVTSLTSPTGAHAMAPWAFLVQSSFVPLPPTAQYHLVQFVLYGQFPAYGLLVMILQSKYSLLMCLAIVLFLHFLGYGLLTLVASAPASA
jgi:hypothetical protein